MLKLIIGSIFLIGSFAVAEVSSGTFAGKVKSFNYDDVVVEVGQQTFKVKRASIHQKTFASGDAVLITLSGSDLKKLSSH